MGIKIPDQVVSAPSSTRPAQDRDLKDIGQQALTGTNALNIALQARPDFEALQRTIQLGGEVIQGVEDARIERENIKDAKKLSLDAIEHISEQSGISHTYETLKKANSDWRKKQEIDYKKKYKNDKKGLMEFENKYQTDILLKHESDSVSTYFRKQAIGSIDTSKEVYSLYFDNVSNSENTKAMLYQEYEIARKVLEKAHANEKGITDVTNPDHAVNEAELKKFAWIRGLENMTEVTTINGEKDYSVIEKKINAANYNWEKEHGWILDEKEKLAYKKEIGNRVKEQDKRIKSFETKNNLSNWTKFTDEAQSIFKNKNLTEAEKILKYDDLKKKIKAAQFYTPQGKTMQISLGKTVDSIAKGGIDTSYDVYQEVIDGLGSGIYTSTLDEIKNGRFAGQRIIDLIGTEISFEDHDKIKQIINHPSRRAQIAEDLKFINEYVEGIIKEGQYINYTSKETNTMTISFRGIVKKLIEKAKTENPDIKVETLLSKQIIDKNGNIINNPNYIDKSGNLAKALLKDQEDMIREIVPGAGTVNQSIEAKKIKARKKLIIEKIKPGSFAEKQIVYVVNPSGFGSNVSTIVREEEVNKIKNSVTDKGKIKPISSWTIEEKEQIIKTIKIQIKSITPNLTPAEREIIIDDLLVESGLKELKD